MHELNTEIRLYGRVNIVSEISGKLWRMKGYLSVNINTNIGVILSMKNEDGKIKFNDTINYYLTI